MAAPTCLGLVQELAKRMGEFYLFTVNGDLSTTTSLQDPGLSEIILEDVLTDLNVWVYGVATTTGGMVAANAGNRGVVRRATAYDASEMALIFTRAWPDLPTTGNYEVHTRSTRARKLEAINSAIRILPSGWPRPILNEVAVTTAQNTWRYALPSSTLWAAVKRVEIQMSTSVGLSGYPYADAGPYNWRIDTATDTSGNIVYYLQFAQLPPPGRLLRFIGTAGYADLVAEGDVLPIPDNWSEAQEFIYDYAAFRLWEWEANRMPSGQTERIRQAKQESLMYALKQLEDGAKSRGNIPLAIPGRGDGQYPWSGPNADYFAANSTPGY
jgi:hypothetical protein